ncbi:hypothetical protein [Aeromonas veronii]|uniref:hypothetical protein n=1 Tax=Aeromonas veronii TaxID=654 RepID=UPI003D25F757
MFEFILGGISSIIFGLVQEIIKPYIFNILKINPTPKTEESIEIPQEIPNPSDEVAVEKWRAYNREKLQLIFSRFYFYAVAYGSVYFAFLASFLFHDAFSNHGFNLTSSKLHIDFIIDNSNASTISAILGVIFFLPLWKASKCIANLIANIMIRFTFVNEIKYLSYAVLSMIFLSFFLSGNISWLLRVDSAWFDSVKTSMILCGLLFAAAFMKR